MPARERKLKSAKVTTIPVSAQAGARGLTNGTGQVNGLGKVNGTGVTNGRAFVNGTGSWRGKPWASHHGAQAASGDWLMFADADTWFEPDGFARVLFMSRANRASSPRPSPPEEEREKAPAARGLCSRNGRHTEPTAVKDLRGAFSVGPYHAVRRPYEDLSLFFNFNMIAGTVPEGLFGQMLLVDRESYWRVGGLRVAKHARC